MSCLTGSKKLQNMQWLLILSSQAEQYLGFGKLQSQGSSLSVHTTLMGKTKIQICYPLKEHLPSAWADPVLASSLWKWRSLPLLKSKHGPLFQSLKRKWALRRKCNAQLLNCSLHFLWCERADFSGFSIILSANKEGLPNWPRSNNSGSVLSSHNARNKSKSILLQCLFWAAKIQAELLQIITCINTVLLASALVYLS